MAFILPAPHLSCFFHRLPAPLNCSLCYLPEPAPHIACYSHKVCCHSHLALSRGRILGRNWDKSLKSFPPCYCTGTSTNGFYPPPPPHPPPPSKSGLKLICNVNIVYLNLRSETSQDCAKKPQRNSTFMNSTSVPEFIDSVFAKTSPWRSFSIIEDQCFELVFAKTGSIHSGTYPISPNLLVFSTIPSKCCMTPANLSCKSQTSRTVLKFKSIHFSYISHCFEQVSLFIL